MNEIAFRKAIEQTDTFKSFPIFKQGLTVKYKNIVRLFDYYQQAKRYGIDYLKQNQQIFATDVAMIEEIL